MSYNKLNVFHWHITDTHSFPLHLKSVPELARYGAYSPEKTYSAKDVADLVNYARVRGVKVMPEFDAPAHVGNGWQFAEKNHPEWGKLVRNLWFLFPLALKSSTFLSENIII